MTEPQEAQDIIRRVEVFTAYQRPLGYESGTLKNVNSCGFYVSVPLDVESGRALLNLEP